MNIESQISFMMILSFILGDTRLNMPLISSLPLILNIPKGLGKGQIPHTSFLTR